MLKPLIVAVFTQRDEPDWRITDHDDARVICIPGIEKALPHPHRIETSEALKVWAHHLATKLSHPGGVGWATSAKTPVARHGLRRELCQRFGDGNGRLGAGATIPDLDLSIRSSATNDDDVRHTDELSVTELYAG